MRLARRQSVNSEFERETKLVVLNFMGLVPASCPATAGVCDMVRVDVSSEEEEEEEDMRSTAHSGVPFSELQEEVQEQLVEENCSVAARGFQNGAVSSEHGTVLLDSERVSATEIVVDTRIETSSREELCPDSVAASTSHQLSNNSANHLQPGMLQVPSSSHSPSPHGGASGPSSVERQSSLRSTSSSRRSSPRNASINVQQADVEALVKTHSLPPLVIPLRDEISHELEALGQEHRDTDAAQGIKFHYSKLCRFCETIIY